MGPSVDGGVDVDGVRKPAKGRGQFTIVVQRLAGAARTPDVVRPFVTDRSKGVERVTIATAVELNLPQQAARRASPGVERQRPVDEAPGLRPAPRPPGSVRTVFQSVQDTVTDGEAMGSPVAL